MGAMRPASGKRGLHSLCPGAGGVAPIGVFWRGILGIIGIIGILGIIGNRQ